MEPRRAGGGAAAARANTAYMAGGYCFYCRLALLPGGETVQVVPYARAPLYKIPSLMGTVI